MAKRNVNPIYFGDISYTSANHNKRWYLDSFKTGSVAFAGDKVEAASVITSIFASGITGAAGVVAPNAVVLSSPNAAANTPITIAVRIPQTKKLITALLQKMVLPTGSSYALFVSGRSDKRYTEIIDWVKIAGSEEVRLESDIDGWIPNVTKISSVASEPAGLTASDSGVLGMNAGNITMWDGSGFINLGAQPTNSEVTQVRFFPYMSAWIKLEIYDVGVNDVEIERTFFHDFIEDSQIAGELAPEAAMVYPLDGKDWLPSQTIYATARVKEMNSDACHFGFEIYKEATSPVTGQTWNGAGTFGTTGGDHLVFQIESNALNLDGTKNENYSRTWHPLGVLANSSLNSVRLAGSPGNPRAILIVPLEGVNGATSASFSNIKFYKNAGNQLLLDVVNDTAKLVGTPNITSAITLPVTAGKLDSEKRKTAQGWVIELNAANRLQGFDRIDFIGPAAVANQVTKVEVYYIDSDIALIPSGKDTVEVDTDGVIKWRPDDGLGGVINSYQAPAWEANIEFCFPKTNNYVDGYVEGTVIQLQNESNNEYNPSNNGNGFDQTNSGDWPKVPKYAGLILGSNASGLVNGDSPIGTTDIKVTTEVITNLDKTVYVRVALPDPYADGERYHVRAYVWDGRTKLVT